MVKVMDCGIVESEFILQSHYYIHLSESHWVPLSYGLVPHLSKKFSKLPHYYIHFRANTLGKGMNPLILPAMG